MPPCSNGSRAGDGNLKYGLEKILKIYYDCQNWKTLHAALDYPFITTLRTAAPGARSRCWGPGVLELLIGASVRQPSLANSNWRGRSK